jgi:hypothetical protein
MTAAEPDGRTMLEHALEYLALGYPIFPVCSPLMGSHRHMIEGKLRECTPDRRGKNPMAPWKSCQTELPSAAQVRAWWGQWPNANIGMATGALSGVVVLDCDNGEASRVALEKGGLEKAPAVWTGTPGGLHLWIEHPGYPVKNFVREIAGTDFRGDGGYVLLPPSRHHKGATYRWNEHTLGKAPPPVPSWLEPSLNGRSGSAGGDGNQGAPLDLDAILVGIGEGARNDTLYRYAGKLRGDDVPQAYAEQLIRQAARLCKPPYDEDAAVDMIRRAYREYEPNVELPDFDISDLDDGPLRVPGTEAAPIEAVALKPFLRPISELLALPEVPPDWMVENLFTVGSSGWVGAEPKVGKSWTVLELIYALTTGTPFLGKFAVRQPRKVIYIQEEDSLQRVLRRFKQLLRGTPGRIPPHDDYLRWSIGVGFKLDSATWMAMLRAELDLFRADVVFLDVFNRLHLKNENDQAEMSAILDQLIVLTREFGCSFIVVHHNRKPQQGNEARPNQSLRGSGVLAGWSECSLYLRKGKQKGAFIVVPESKDAPEMDEFGVTLVDTDDGGVVLEIGDVTIADRLADTQVKIVEAIEALLKDGLDATMQRIADRVGLSRVSVSRHIKDLVENGTIKEDEVKIGKTYAKFFSI